ncbi:MAG: hypothetical protein ACTSUE_12465 [Promethearchaeota archaeon]
MFAQQSMDVSQHVEQLLQLKVIYWGPAEAGKTTSLVHVYTALGRFAQDKLLKVQTTQGRTLWSEYGALLFELPGRDGPVPTLIHVSAVTGQERFLNTREFAVASTDGVIFVADCRPQFIHATERSYEELIAFIPRSVPVIVQANFQDEFGALLPDDIEKRLKCINDERDPGRRIVRVNPTIASEGVNTVGTFLQLLVEILSPGG